MLELYNSPVSTCSQKVRMTLAEKRLSWTDRPIVFARNDHLSDWYLKLNPNGVVPTLVHDGSVITDSSVINEYLDEVFPDRPLRPSNLVELARMRAWRQYIDEVPTPSIRYPSFNAYFVPIWSGMSDEEFRAYVEQLPLRKHFYLKMGRTGFPQEEIDAALERLRQTVERMERALEQTSWLAHDMFTLADISIMPSIVRMDDLDLHYLWADLPRVADWYARLQQRPAFATTYFPGTRELGPSC
ncbi:MAG: glutathione S-transferase family protein [Stellaceae bacterium]